MRKQEQYVWGLLLVGFGILLILGNLGWFNFGKLIATFWPITILFASLLFHAGYYAKRPKCAGLLVPGGILLTVGIVCQISMLFNNWDVTWPGFILAPAIGLFELYVFSKKKRGLLIPIVIIAGLAAVLFFSISFNELSMAAKYVIPAGLILIGIGVMAKRDDDEEPPHDYNY